MPKDKKVGLPKPLKRDTDSAPGRRRSAGLALARVIDAALERSGLSRKDLAEHLGMKAQETLTGWQRGTTKRVDLGQLIELFSVANCSMDETFKLTPAKLPGGKARANDEREYDNLRMELRNSRRVNDVLTGYIVELKHKLSQYEEVGNDDGLLNDMQTMGDEAIAEIERIARNDEDDQPAVI